MTCIVEIAYLLLFKSTTNSIIARKFKEVRTFTSCFILFSSSPKVTMELYNYLCNCHQLIIVCCLNDLLLTICRIVFMIWIAVRLRKLSISKAGRNNESHNITPRANNGLSVKCNESHEIYVDVKEPSSAKAFVFPNTEN